MARRRGQPVFVLSVLLAGWALARAAYWHAPFAAEQFQPVHTSAHANAATAVERLAVQSPKSAGIVRGRSARATSFAKDTRATNPQPLVLLPAPDRLPDARGDAVAVLAADQRARTIPGHVGAVPARRWNVDSWVLLRPSGGIAAQAPGQAAYGASQAGAVLRYHLGSGAGPAPFIYLRGSAAIGAPGRDREVALGLGVRPVARLPVRLLAEARLQDGAAAPLRLRPVVAAVTELPWQALPAGFRGEIYGQGGYAGGRNATAFFDVQAVADRPVPAVLPASADLRIGAGVWAGGQKDAMRLDTGPRLSVRLDNVGRVPLRLAVDWRVRLAGNARPGSGPALTLASSF